jgi:hypothetical protein
VSGCRAWRQGPHAREPARRVKRCWMEPLVWTLLLVPIPSEWPESARGYSTAGLPNPASTCCPRPPFGCHENPCGDTDQSRKSATPARAAASVAHASSSECSPEELRGTHPSPGRLERAILERPSGPLDGGRQAARIDHVVELSSEVRRQLEEDGQRRLVNNRSADKTLAPVAQLDRASVYGWDDRTPHK